VHQFAEICINRAQGGLDLRQGRGGSDDQLAVAILDGIEPAHAANMNDAGEIAQFLADPGADVRRPGHDGCRWIALIEFGKAVETCRRGEKAVLVSDKNIFLIGKGSKTYRRLACSLAE